MTQTAALALAVWVLLILFILIITWQPPRASDRGLAEIDAKMAAKRQEWHEQMGRRGDPGMRFENCRFVDCGTASHYLTQPDVAAPRKVRAPATNPPTIEQLQRRLAAMRADGTASKLYTETETVGDALEAHIAARMAARGSSEGFD